MLATRRVFHAPSVSSYDSVVLADTPVGFWPLNDTTGTTAVDVSGNGLSGTYSGSFSLGASALFSDGKTSVNFTGGKMAVPDAAPLRLGAGNISIEMVFKLSSIPPYATVCDNDRSYSLFLNDASDPSHIYSAFGSVGNITLVLPSALSTGTIYHLVATSSGSSMKPYLNGTVGSTTSSSAGATNSSTGVSLFGNPSGGGGLAQGQAAKFAIYNYVLTSGQVAAHWAAR